MQAPVDGTTGSMQLSQHPPPTNQAVVEKRQKIIDSIPNPATDRAMHETTLFSLPLPLLSIILTTKQQDEDASSTPSTTSSMISYETHPPPAKWTVKHRQPAQHAFYQTCWAARDLIRSMMTLSAGLVLVIPSQVLPSVPLMPRSVTSRPGTISPINSELMAVLNEQLSNLPRSGTNRSHALFAQTSITKLEVKVSYKAAPAHALAVASIGLPQPPGESLRPRQEQFDFIWTSLLPTFPTLTNLSLSIHREQQGIKLSSNQLHFLIESCPRLKSLSLDSEVLSISSLSPLAGLTDLKISSYGGACLEDQEPSTLSHLTNLTSLHLSDRINAVVSEVTHLSCLVSLTFSYPEHDDIKGVSTALALLSSLSRLTRLALGSPDDEPPNEESVALSQALSGITSLTSLTLHRLSLNAPSVRTLSKMPHLTSLKGLWEIDASGVIDTHCQWRELGTTCFKSPASAWSLSVLPDLKVEAISCSSTHQIDLNACLEISASDHAASSHWMIHENLFDEAVCERFARAARMLHTVNVNGDEVYCLSIARPYHLPPVYPDAIIPKLKQPVPPNKSSMIMQLQLNNFVIDSSVIAAIAAAVPSLESLALIGCEVSQDVWTALPLIHSIFHIGLNHCSLIDSRIDKQGSTTSGCVAAIRSFANEWKEGREPSTMLELTVCPPYLSTENLSHLADSFMAEDPVRVIFMYQPIIMF